ncbi:helix-turn-helix transcriptional regulator [Jannaschia pohangensis]|uniref:Transcriptional regulator, AlpA family n=1 Tax=Jannaschia pohangensis TaxID=390807 RepID=A0A1I3MYH0_9RHOB|nr:AlpA family phage regulatory protein [Jannaschia pohangensis]SFJ02019.1 transcriptional regulator, AlpA family [Jannaschia pohangensis]
MNAKKNIAKMTPDGLIPRFNSNKSKDRTRPRLIDRWEVIDMLGISESTLERRMVDDETFPQPRRLGSRTIRWIEADVEAYIFGLEAVDYFSN